MLHGANLGTEFWPCTLTHSVQLCNMIPHSITNQTPYYSLTGKHPTTEWLHVFGCRYYARKLGDQLHKLNYNTSTSIFLRFAATAKNVYYYDTDSKKIKTSMHGIFDEANFTVPEREWSQASQALIDLGYQQDDVETDAQMCPPQSPQTAQIQLLAWQAKIPTQGSVMAAGYDVYSIHKYTLKPSATTKIPLGITIKPPKGSYIQLQSRNGLASKGVIVYAGTIDPDYSGLTTYHVQPGEQIP
jgi:hypothetical protein